MPDPDRSIGGLRCRDLMPVLPDYVDGDLSVAESGRVHAHLDGCAVCRKFGFEYGAVIGLLRDDLRVWTLPRDVNARLLNRMEDLWAREK